jgi:hypothetical protein
MIGYIDTYLQLQSVMTAQNQWLSKTRSTGPRACSLPLSRMTDDESLVTHWTPLQVKVKVTLRLTVSQSVSLGVEPHLRLMTRYLLLFDFYGLVLWGALSAAGARQRSHSRVRVPWDSWPYFTVSDLRLPFSSPHTTRRVTVEVFDPASTRVISPTNELWLFYKSQATRIWVTISSVSSVILCYPLARESVFTKPLPSK